jgi:outer membrane protein OmpA-like peptidoglycan-associated protein
MSGNNLASFLQKKTYSFFLFKPRFALISIIFLLLSCAKAPIAQRIVFFDNQTVLDSLSRDVVVEAATQATASQGAAVRLVWFAHPEGNFASLALARANVVRAQLIASGIPAERISAIGRSPRPGIDAAAEAQRVLIEIVGTQP